jgi:peptidoglycan hydrolase-like protein with peptidoglycan-binding domain
MKNIKYTILLLALMVGQVAGATVAVVTSEVLPVSVSILKKGSQGAEVTALQEQLKDLPGVYPEGFVTGYFGTLTEKAIKRLQAQNSLEQVGFVGPKTRELLLKLSKEAKINDLSSSKTVYEVPMVNVVESSSSGATNGYVFWTTNKMTTSDLWYGTVSPLDTTSAVKVSDSSMSFSHSHNLSGLATSTSYYYIIKVTDEKGNSATTTEKTFKTLSQ